MVREYRRGGVHRKKPGLKKTNVRHRKAEFESKKNRNQRASREEEGSQWEFCDKGCSSLLGLSVLYRLVSTNLRFMESAS